MNVDWLITFYTSLVIFLGAIVHGIAGFGLAQVNMGLMPLFRSVSSAAVINGITAVTSNFRVWWSTRDDFDIKSLLKPLVGVLVGMPLGLYIFRNLDEDQAKKIIGIIILIAVGTIIAGKQTNILDRMFKNVTDKYNTFFAILAGFLAGVLGGAVSIPGPPMIVYGAFMNTAGGWTGKKTKSIFTAFFGLVQLYRTSVVAFSGGITSDLFVEALIALPAMLLGTYVGIKIFDRFSNEAFNWILILALTANAIILLVQ